MLDPNTILQGRYLILRRIGHGGMGAVYLAKDQRLGSLLALKETFFTDERMLKAFEREARLLASLRHPALPRVSDHFAEGDGQFLVMEYIAGDDLEQMLTTRGYGFAPADVLTWADQLLDALDYLHTQQPPIVHRDIKPQNLKLTDRGQIILLDFGLAKGAVSDMTQATGNSSILGYTPGYAPLEQIQAVGTDARSDLYSLAATLYRLMAYTSPPDALRRATTVLNGESDPLEPANQINPHIAASVAKVLHGAMDLKRDARPATASAMRQALREASRVSETAVIAAQTQVAASNSATVSDSPGAPTLVAQTDTNAQLASSAQATRLASPSAASETLAASPGATTVHSATHKRTLWIAIVIVALFIVGALSLVMISNRAKTPGANANSNAAVEGDRTNANQTPANVNRATENAASDESNPNGNARPRTVGNKKEERPGVGGAMRRGLRRLRERMRN
ncbi:MAG: eukaryotic-like serine/threonine-protein kinase [Blastocatellia bacterium]